MKNIALVLSMMLAFIAQGCTPKNLSSQATIRPNQPIKTIPLPTKDNIVCTQDVMQCPDGGWVGRTTPKCEFNCPQMPAK